MKTMWSNRDNGTNPLSGFFRNNNLQNDFGSGEIINPMFQAGFIPSQNRSTNEFWRDRISNQTGGFHPGSGSQGEGRRVFSLDNERLLATVTNTNHRHHQHPPNHCHEPDQDLPNLPGKIYDSPCSLLHIDDFLECGVLQLRGSRGQTANCLFLRRDVLVMGRRERLSYELPRDGYFRANAWLINSCSNIPYLAANVWFEGAQNLPPILMMRISSSADLDSVNVYNQVSNDLTWDLPEVGREREGNSRNVVLVDQEDVRSGGRHLGRQIVFRGDDDQDSDDRAWSPPHTGRRVQVWENSPPTPVRRNVIFSTQETSGISLELGQVRAQQSSSQTPRQPRPGVSGRRSRSTSSDDSSGHRNKKKRSRSRRSSKSTETQRVRKTRSRSPSVDLSKNKILDQLVFENCTTARVSSYLGNGIGVLTICRGTERRREDRKKDLKVAYFHVDQVWTRTPGLGLHQLSEIYRSRDVESQFRVGSTVHCNVRRIRASEADCQAVFVGKSSSDYQAWLKLVSKLEDCSSLEHSVDHNCSLFSLRERNNEKSLSLELLPGTPELCEARVKEYFSLDYGLLELTGEAGTVLFNLSQVYLVGENCWRRLKTSQLLCEKLPLGSTVDILKTSLPCHQHSDLKYQALAVFERSDPNTENPVKFFQSKSKSTEQKLELKKSLRRHFDSFKSFLGLQAHFRNSSFSPVHVVLDSLPDSWQAVIVAVISTEFGIIRISNKTPGNMTLASGRSLQLLNVLFHIEDVFCEEGEKAMRKNFTLASLLNRSVQLTARSICSEESPEGIFEHVEKLLSKNKILIGVPVLQAVTVCLGTAAPEKAPRPTFLRRQVPSFVSGLSYCFLEFGLRTRLDIKLVQFLAEPKKPPLEYKEHINMSYDYKKEKSVVEDLKSIDTETSIKIVFGSLRVKNIDISKQEKLPQSIPRIECKILFLYRTNLKAEKGVLQVVPMVDNSPVECLAYFQYSDLHRQQPLDYLCKDLATLMPCSSKDKFCVSLQLHDPKSKIPYVATKIWNETLRLEKNLPLPNVNTFIDAYSVKFRNSFIKSMIATCLSQTAQQEESPTVAQQEKSPTVAPQEKSPTVAQEKSPTVAQQKKSPAVAQQKESPTVAQQKKSLTVALKSPKKENNREDPKTELAAYVENISSKTLLVGKVLRIINTNFALAVCVLPDRSRVQVLFDVFDVWNTQDGKTDVLANQSKTIKDVMSAGDFLKLHVVEVKRSTSNVKRQVSHMATAVITAKTFSIVRDKEFPEGAVILESLEAVDENKVLNFEKVVKIIENLEMGPSEKSILSDLAGMFENSQDSKVKVNIKLEKSEEVNNQSAKTDIVKTAEIQIKLKEELDVENKPASNIVTKRELAEAVDEMLKAAAEVRDGFRLSNPTP